MLTIVGVAVVAPSISPAVVGAAPAVVPAGAGKFTPLAPTRILDTRDGTGAAKGVVAAGASIVVQVTGTLVPAGATAVAFNLTATNALAAGFVSAWPTGSPLPTVSNLNLPGAGATVANLVVVALSAGGQVSLYSQNGTDLVADVAGYWTAATGGVGVDGRFVSQRPARILDTRSGIGVPPPAPGVPAKASTVTFTVAGQGGVPQTGAGAAVMVVTATEAVAQGFVTAWPAGGPQPLASVLNLKNAGDTVPNLVIVPIGTGGQVSLFTQGGAHLVVDVVGWFTDGTGASTSDGLFVPLPPERFLDSRARSPFGKLWPGQRNDLPVLGKGAVPATGVSAVIANITSTDATAPGFVTAWPAATGQPVASNLNSPGPVVAGPNSAGRDSTVAGLTFVGVGSTGAFSLYSQSGTQIIADVSGYFLGNGQPAEAGVPVTPPPPPAPPLVTRPTVAGAGSFACNAGPPMDQIQRVDVNPGLLGYLQDLPTYANGTNLPALAYTFMANSGPLPARVALDPEWDFWISTGSLTQITSPDQFLDLLNLAYHETIHHLQNGRCALTGPGTGYATPRLGFFQSEIFDDVNTRIDAIGLLSPNASTFYPHRVADGYLAPGDPISAQGFESQMWEINAYVLAAEWGAAVNDTFGVAFIGDTAGNDDTMSIKFHQLARYLNRASTQPALWAQLQSTAGLPRTVTEQWNLGVKSWQVDRAPGRDPSLAWDLAFGPDVGPIVAFTGGAAGTTAPPRPPATADRARSRSERITPAAAGVRLIPVWLGAGNARYR